VITYSLIGLTCLISFLAFQNERLFSALALHPSRIYSDRSKAYQMLSYGFVHADYQHLIFNMLSLFFFAPAIENTVFSSGEFIFLYVSALVVSAIPGYLKNKQNARYSAVGASGAVSAVLFSCVLFMPWSVIYIKFIFPLYFILFALGYVIYSYVMGKRQSDNIGHDAHLWGALYGLVFTMLTHPAVIPYFIDQLQHPPFLN
jgi:membrane associated rhomboid family serine protease